MQHRLWCNAEVQGQFAEHGSDEDSDEDSNDEGAGTAEPDAPRGPGMANARTAAAVQAVPVKAADTTSIVSHAPGTVPHAGTDPQAARQSTPARRWGRTPHQSEQWKHGWTALAHL